jgi:hypothetical protein
MFEAEHPDMPLISDTFDKFEIFEFYDLFEVNSFLAVPKSAT